MSFSMLIIKKYSNILDIHDKDIIFIEILILRMKIIKSVGPFTLSEDKVAIL